MIHVSRILPQGRGLAKVLLKRAGTVSLDWSARSASRFEAVDSEGRSLAVDLPAGTTLRGGDVLVAEDGSLVRVQAAPQAVLHVSHCAEHGAPRDLLRVAYQLGTQHVPVELQDDHLATPSDPALAESLRAMHLIVREATLPFEPEPAREAHGHGQEHAHGHGHGHGHGHDHDHDHAHAHDTAGRAPQGPPQAHDR